MSNTVISVENVSKQYRLGVIGTGTFRNDLKLWWAKTKNKPNPLALVDEVDYGNRENDILWALRDVSFKVEQGEALGIIGRNGAGKSTLLKILSRVTSPTSGEVKVKGRIASLLEVGTGFHPELTGRENIFLNGAIMGMSRPEVARKFDEIVDFSGVEKFIDTPVKRYSSGMYVRLAFAVAAHLEPEILIVDEVLAVGDAEFQKKCLGKMGDVTHQGRTVLFVSHNLRAVQNLCEHAILIEKGTIVNSGTTSKIIENYLIESSIESYIFDKSKINKNDLPYFSKINIVDQNLNPTNVITHSDSLRILIDLEVNRKIRGLHLGFALLNSNKEQIFGSSPQDNNNINLNKIGHYRFLLTLPEGILNTQTYFLKLMLWTPTDGMLDSIDNINIIVLENPSTTNHSKEVHHGFLAIRCKWDLLENN